MTDSSKSTTRPAQPEAPASLAMVFCESTGKWVVEAEPMLARLRSLITQLDQLRESSVPVHALQDATTRHMNFWMDLRRVLSGERTLCSFKEVDEVRQALAARDSEIEQLRGALLGAFDADGRPLELNDAGRARIRTLREKLAPADLDTAPLPDHSALGELLLCPHCGSDPLFYPDGDMEGHHVMCSGNRDKENTCRNNAFGFATAAEAAAAWNRRTGQTATTVPDSEELRRAVRAMVALLADKEWAEHLSTDPDAQNLESAVTQLVGEAQVRASEIVHPTRDMVEAGMQAFIDAGGESVTNAQVELLWKAMRQVQGGRTLQPLDEARVMDEVYYQILTEKGVLPKSYEETVRRIVRATERAHGILRQVQAASASRTAAVPV